MRATIVFALIIMSYIAVSELLTNLVNGKMIEVEQTIAKTTEEITKVSGYNKLINYNCINYVFIKLVSIIMSQKT